MSDNSIVAKAAAADRFVSEYSSEVSNFEAEMRGEINDMYSVLNGLFGSWTGELADQYRIKIESNLEELTNTCDRTKKLSAVLEKRAEGMRAMLEKLKKAGING